MNINDLGRVAVGDRALVNQAPLGLGPTGFDPSRGQITCPDCDGQGWTVATDYEAGCCGGSEWECGGRGCTGPIQEPVCVQEQCERCCGTGEVRAAECREFCPTPRPRYCGQHLVAIGSGYGPGPFNVYRCANCGSESWT